MVYGFIEGDSKNISGRFQEDFRTILGRFEEYFRKISGRFQEDSSHLLSPYELPVRIFLQLCDDGIQDVLHGRHLAGDG